jgi:hypothetical protein
MPKLIGLGGKKRHGKDEFAKGLGDDWVIVGMAEPLYDLVLTDNNYIGVDDQGNLIRVAEFLAQHNNDWVEAKKHPEIRRMLQVKGTESGRKMFGENVWVDKMLDTVRKHLDSGKNVAVTGIRFPNEAQAIRDAGGTLVWVERPNFEEDKDSNSGHASENSVTYQDFDMVVANNSTLDALYQKAHDLFNN